MSIRFVSRSVVIAAAVMLTGSATASDPIARTWGGGRAVVTNEEGFLPPGVVTEFSINVWIGNSGAAMGRFVCFVQGGSGGFTANITGGFDLGGGCVLLTGTSTCIFTAGGGVFFDEPVTVLVCAGGPGAGNFRVCFDNMPEFGCDEETVINGAIRYRSP